MSELLLTMGNKNYSSWSLRPWILMKHLGLNSSERLLPLDTPEFARDVVGLSPTRRVPVLNDEELEVWDSLAICEYACELAGRGRPPARAARATGRDTAPNPERIKEIARVEQLWNDCRTRFGTNGPWLFGEYGVADATYAPVVLRFRTYGARVGPSSTNYMQTVLADAFMRDRLEAAAAESSIIEASEIVNLRRDS
jgi:glutathione S-transferase